MTKDTYFDMCEQMGIDPIEDEIPLDYTDFPDLVQTCFFIYSKLRDVWDPMSGAYSGKDYSIVFNLFELYDVDTSADKSLAMDFLHMMDSSRIKIISDKIKAQSHTTK